MPVDLGRRLIAAGVVSPQEVEAALFLSVVRGVPFPRALVDRGALGERALDDELGRRGGLALRNVVGVPELVAKLPSAMCRRLGAVPTRLDPFTGTVDVAAADPLDPHIAIEMNFHLEAPIRVIRAPMTAIEEAIRRLELEEAPSLRRPPIARSRRETPPFPHGAPSSSVPPPPSVDIAIPLVRRANAPLVDQGDVASPMSDAEPAPSSTGLRTSLPGLSRLQDDDRPVPSERRPPVIRDPVGVPPKVSFPSSPPAQRVTPRDSALGAPPPRHPLQTRRPALRIGLPEAGARGPVSVETWPKAAEVVVPSGDRSTPAQGTVASVEPVVATTSDRPSARPGGRQSRRTIPMGAASAQGESSPAAAVDAPPQARAAALRPPPPPPDAFAALARAVTRDDVVQGALLGLSDVAARVALFVVKRDGYHGWSCNPAFGEEAALREVVVPIDQPSIFATAVATRVYLGPVPRTAAHTSLLGVLKTDSRDVAAIAVRAGGRPVMVLVADDLTDTMRGTKHMETLAKAVSDALLRVLATRS